MIYITLVFFKLHFCQISLKSKLNTTNAYFLHFDNANIYQKTT